MFSTLKRLYDSKRLTNKQLEHAVELGWITQEEYENIVKNKETK